MKLYVLDLGRMRMDRNLFASGALIATCSHPDIKNEHVEFPVQAFLIEGPNGYVLYDTGAHPDAMGPAGRWPLAFQDQCPYFGDESRSVVHRLKSLGIDTRDIKTVILSHMHNDHAGGVEFFPHAKFIVHEKEFAACMVAYGTHAYMSSYIWKDTDVWSKMPIQWEFIQDSDADLDLFQGLTIINLGSGHARGLLALYVRLQNTGGIIITSDAVYNAENFGDTLREPGVVYDTVGWRNSARKLKNLTRKTGAAVWFGHDMEQFSKIKKSDEGYYD